MHPDSWSKVAREVEALSGPSARAWLASATPVDAEQGSLCLEVPSIFVRDALRQRCGGALLQAARSAGFERVDLRVALPRGQIEVGPSFSSFRVTPGNQLAYAAVTSLAKKPRPELHPLVLFGPPGCGKSHLLAALASSARRHRIAPLVVTQAPRLASRIALSARDKRLDAMRAALRGAKLFILDQGERLGGKVKTQAELVHALDALGAAGGVMVLALRVSPSLAPGLSSPLRSRLQGGLIAQVE